MDQQHLRDPLDRYPGMMRAQQQIVEQRRARLGAQAKLGEQRRANDQRRTDIVLRSEQGEVEGGLEPELVEPAILADSEIVAIEDADIGPRLGRLAPRALEQRRQDRAARSRPAGTCERQP